jgi:hypothetical protein
MSQISEMKANGAPATGIRYIIRDALANISAHGGTLPDEVRRLRNKKSWPYTGTRPGASVKPRPLPPGSKPNIVIWAPASPPQGFIGRTIWVNIKLRNTGTRVGTYSLAFWFSDGQRRRLTPSIGASPSVGSLDRDSEKMLSFGKAPQTAGKWLCHAELTTASGVEQWEATVEVR